MIRILFRWVLPTLMVAVVMHVATVMAVPRIIMRVVMDRIGKIVPVDAPFHAAQVTAAARNVPLPSPDLLYSSCVLDLAAGPVLVSVTPGAAYLSLALFDLRSDNVFVTNDQSSGDQNSGGKPISLLVTGPGQDVPAPAGAAVAKLDTSQGLLLVRGLAATPELAAISDKARHTLSCQRWNTPKPS